MQKLGLVREFHTNAFSSETKRMSTFNKEYKSKGDMIHIQSSVAFFQELL